MDSLPVSVSLQSGGGEGTRCQPCDVSSPSPEVRTGQRVIQIDASASETLLVPSGLVETNAIDVQRSHCWWRDTQFRLFPFSPPPSLFLFKQGLTI